VKFGGAQILLSVVIAAVAVVVVAGLWISGSPAKARGKRLDIRRTRDLQLLSSSIKRFWAREKHLPASLADLTKQPDIGTQRMHDPQSGRVYEYRVTQEDHYELCAHFSLATETPGRGSNEVNFWAHEAGHQCFTLSPRDLNLDHVAAP